MHPESSQISSKFCTGEGRAELKAKQSDLTPGPTPSGPCAAFQGPEVLRKQSGCCFWEERKSQGPPEWLCALAVTPYHHPVL